MEIKRDFWKGKNVLITGHTGFKGSWLSLWLSYLGANVTGISLDPDTDPNLYSQIKIYDDISSLRVNINDFNKLNHTIKDIRPEIVFHLAAQPLVIESYLDPIKTFHTNFIGTLNILESIRFCDSVRCAVLITTDKVYENNDDNHAYKEYEKLNGDDPYSASKAASEILINSYSKSFFMKDSDKNDNPLLASVRAGNVIGGGDWAKDRIIPDAVKSFSQEKDLVIRYPNSIRPWQNVLEPLSGYILIAQNLFLNQTDFTGSWNFGPDEKEETVMNVITKLKKEWGANSKIIINDKNNHHEAKILKLDCTKAKTKLNWRPQWSLDITISKLTAWYKSIENEEKLRNICISDIEEYTTTFNDK